MTPIEIIIWRAKKCDSISREEINAARTELAELLADRDRITALEKEMKDDPILLHDCASRDEWPDYPRGLSLLKGQRDLRRALDCLRGIEQPTVPIQP